MIGGVNCSVKNVVYATIGVFDMENPMADAKVAAHELVIGIDY